MPIISIVSSQFRPENAEEAIAALHDVLEQTRAFPGCLEVEVARDVSDPVKVFVVEKWQSLEDDTAYRAWRKAEGLTPEMKRMAGFRVGAEVRIGEALPGI